MPDLAAQRVIGLFAPMGTPKEIIEQIAEATRKAMADPDLQLRHIGVRARPRFKSRKDAAPA